jgi:hypothetical protein
MVKIIKPSPKKWGMPVKKMRLTDSDTVVIMVLWIEMQWFQNINILSQMNKPEIQHDVLSSSCLKLFKGKRRFLWKIASF